jgi:hypothetical protein
MADRSFQSPTKRLNMNLEREIISLVEFHHCWAVSGWYTGYDIEKPKCIAIEYLVGTATVFALPTTMSNRPG